MGAPLTEFVMESVIRDGLGALRANPAVFDDIFSKFKEAYFERQYGQNQIDKLKTYVLQNQIRIVHAWSQVPASAPCISIQIMRSQEAPNLQQFGNEYEDYDYEVDPTPYVENVTPTAYDQVTGKLSIDASVDLSPVRPGFVFVDAAGTEFTIQSGNSNLAGNKYINIGKGGQPDLSGPGEIVGRVKIERVERKMIRISETISLGIHAKDQIHIAKYLYYLLVYILKSRGNSLIKRGINLDYGSGDVFDREDKSDDNVNIFSRFMQVNCHTEYDWNQDQVNLIDCFDLTVKSPSGTAPDGTVVVSPKDE